MFQLIKRREMKVTPDMAGRFSNLNAYEGQRPEVKRHTEMLMDCIENGSFTLGWFAVANCKWNGCGQLLANGQHQASAIMQTGKTVTAIVDEYDCETPEDFSKLYRTFDNNRTRTLAEIALPEARALKLDWSKKFISQLLAGVAYLEGSKHEHKTKRVQALKKYIREGNLIHDIFTPVPFPEYRHMARGPVIASMIITFRKDAAAAETFWEEVRDGDNLKASSPSLKLRNYLLSTTVGVGRGVSAPSLNAAVSYNEMYAKCITAWNAYRRGDPTALKFYADKPIPKPI